MATTGYDKTHGGARSPREADERARVMLRSMGEEQADGYFRERNRKLDEVALSTPHTPLQKMRAERDFYRGLVLLVTDRNDERGIWARLSAAIYAAPILDREIANHLSGC